MTMISSKEDSAILLMIIWHSSIPKFTRIFTYVLRFIRSIKRRIQSSKVKQRTTKMSESLKSCSSTPNERTDSDECTSQPMIRTYNSVSFQEKDSNEGWLQLYSFIQRNFLQEHKIIRNQPNEDASNSSRDATPQDVQQSNKFTGTEGVGGIVRAGGPDAYINTRICKGTEISLLTNVPQRLGRAGGPGCLVSVDGVGVSTDDVSHGIGWVGALGISCTSCLPGIQTFLAKQYINSTKMKPEQKCFLTPMEQPLRHRRRKFPFTIFDEEIKVIRVGGRLANSPYTIDRKIPVLIPRKSPITEMLIREAHDKNLHGGPQLT